MKKKSFLKIALLALIPVFYFFIFAGINSDKSSAGTKEVLKPNVTNSQVTPTKDFINYIYNMNYYGRHDPSYWEYGLSVENQLGRYKGELNYDGIHIYSGAGPYNNGTSLGGNFHDSLGAYLGYVNGLMTTVNNAGLKGIYGRSRIETLTNVQSVDYEVKASTQSDKVNYGYCYDTIMTGVTYQTDSGRTVLYANTQTNNEGWLCRGIYENLQHSDLSDWQWSDFIEWKLRPTMRIKQSDFSPTDYRPVVAVVVKNFHGHTMDSIIIRVRNFRNATDNYNGEYKNQYFYSSTFPDSLRFSGKDSVGCLNENWNSDLENDCKVDFQVYWFDNVDVWFDKMTVQTGWADTLFNSNQLVNYDAKVIQEVNAFKDKVYAFFTDEMSYSCLKSTRYIKDLIKSVDQNIKFQFVTTNFFNTRGFRNDTIYHQAMIDIVQPDFFSFDAHEFLSYLPVQFKDMNTGFPNDWKAENNYDYNQSLQLRVLGDRTSRTDETTFEYENPFNPTPQGSYIYQLVRNKTYADYMQPRAMMLAQPQIHANMEWKQATGKYWGNREPTNEEIEAQMGISIAHGADGFSLFTYQSHSWPTNGSISYFSDLLKTHYPDTVEPTPADSFMFIGLLELNSPERRIYNMYGQEKWDYISSMNLKIKNWKPYLDKINWKSGWSVHSEGANHEYIKDIKSIYRNPQLEFEPEDDPEERYWEIGFYEPNPFLNPATDKSKYFIAVNRRCVPETSTGEGDLRKLRIHLDSNQLQHFKNWKITDLNSGNDILTFNKNSNIYHNLGEFLPGEAKLFRLAPVMQEGGTLVCDEQFGNLEFNCNNDVISGGFNVDIGQGTKINFEIGKKLTMNGGEFTCGYSIINNPSTTTVTMSGKGGADWGGIVCNGSPLVKINKTQFSKLKENTPNTSYILNATDCPVISIYNSEFTVESNRINCGAISINYINEPNAEEYIADITGNTFNILGTGVPVVQVQGYSFTQIPLLMKWNTFYGNNSLNAIFLNNVTGGIIRNNHIDDFQRGILSVVSYIDLFDNVITNVENENYNLELNTGSYFNLNSDLFGYYFGGLNKLNTTGELSSNILLNNSYFEADKGFNVFYVKSGYVHFTGTLNDDYFTSNDIVIYENCFKADDHSDYLNHDLSWQINLGSVNYEPGSNNCGNFEPEGFYVVYYGEIEDTLWYKPVGMGGGNSSKTEVSSQNIFTLKSDSLKLNLRKRNYNDVTRIGNELLNTYPDSAGIINVIQPIYFASLVTDDSTDTKISNFKTKLESLISSNGNNTSLVLRCNYFIQKCKVKLGEYQSALSGFQQIMQNFPYNWEGVVAGWDYSATQLLAGGGSGQGFMKDKNINHELH